MAFTVAEKHAFKAVVAAFIEKRRPPDDIRPRLDLGFRITDQSIEIFEIRPVWNDPTRKRESCVAKATYVRSRGLWKVYWVQADLQWHSYHPKPAVRRLQQFLELVDKDAHHCFWG